ncbi:transcriptional regulator [Frankia casuarinae]|uniref:Transcriptional regulator, MarR family n=1 Tax=Frankia casuarinae (strain DSM 45818 / CECT 9043 / HFP020203 / CcI3) TaxID=106370 RepID=Q2JAY6_FRACC|nr:MULTISPECIES: MarR family winged helix-turn-helix transcriptional regulator [Frankia]ABD11556.1 transcriptional regulator, MarR family [Frankia casuarinae]ESZ99769.1 transcriptional regulator [Frankia sp. CcI6]EYT91607.1 transcriptional regulator [Frankia casuarinae]KDA41169.1 transcriptional regulator [Frankia sp. BMG5.23]KEZ34942.1 transcriptional regulator [Frankia sp. CeD]
MGDDASATPDAAAGPANRSALGGLLRRAWVGYQNRLDEQLAAAGFERQFPDGRVLRFCAGSSGATVAQIGRHLGITRQGAAKIVNRLVTSDYLEVSPSETSGRENTVRLTLHGQAYLTTHRAAARRIEDDLRTALGPEAFDSLTRLLAALGAGSDERLTGYLRRRTTLADVLEL